jgi:hypothetical protein
MRRLILAAASGFPFGQTWTARTLSSSGSYTAVAYGAGLYVVIPASGTTYLTSPDGSTWTTRSLPVSKTWSCGIIYANSLFVIGSSDTVIYYSSDGINWTNGYNQAGTYTTYGRVAYANSKFVILGHSLGNTNTYVHTSSDGQTWTSTVVTGAVNYTWDAVAYGNGTWLAMSLASTNAMMTSSNGTSWTVTGTAGLSIDCSSGLAYGAGLFVAVDTSGTATTTYKTSSTGNAGSWTSRTLPASLKWTRLVCVSNVFILLSQTSNTVYLSTDGINWTGFALPSTTYWSDVALGPGNQLVAITNNASTVAATSP